MTRDHFFFYNRGGVEASVRTWMHNLWKFGQMHPDKSFNSPVLLQPSVGGAWSLQGQSRRAGQTS